MVTFSTAKIYMLTFEVNFIVSKNKALTIYYQCWMSQWDRNKKNGRICLLIHIFGDNKGYHQNVTQAFCR